MAVGFGAPCPKPARTRKQLKARKGRREQKVEKTVREQVSERDGYCRLLGVGPYDCGGFSEWAHLEGKRRARTRGMEPEDRHTTADSMMLCRTHHTAYDARQIAVTFLTRRGANGPMTFEFDGLVYSERVPASPLVGETEQES